MKPSITTKPQYGRNPSVPHPQYERMEPIWRRTRAVLSGQEAAKDFDDRMDFTENLLIPFSPSMSPQQYEFYKTEAEFPGLVGQYTNILIGALLRKAPTIVVDDALGLPDEAVDWLRDEFTVDDQPLSQFLHEVLFEEFCGRSFVLLDYPPIDYEIATPEQIHSARPFPRIWSAEQIVNWQTSVNPVTGQTQLSRIMLRYMRSVPTEDNPFHDDLIDTIDDLYLDEQGFYTIDRYEFNGTAEAEMVNGRVQHTDRESHQDSWVIYETIQPLMNGQRIPYIPGVFTNGSIQPQLPLLQPMVNREIGLYNKLSRRNHLLYTACTFTPVIISSMTDEQFQSIVDQGLGTFIRLQQGDSITTLEPPLGAIGPLENAIEATVQELGRMGMRHLIPEGSQESGYALQIRNSSQTSQLASLNQRISQSFKSLLAMMLTWRYGVEVLPSDVTFALSNDFGSIPVGENWMRLITEWFESAHIPRSLWLRIAKEHDLIPADYNDEEGQIEIAENSMTAPPLQEQFFPSGDPANDDQL